MKAIAFFDPRVNDGVYGSVFFEQPSVSSPVQIFFSLKGFEPFSVHAVHIHEFGDLTEGCKTLGTHFNPTNRQHSHSEQGHAGDLFNNFQADFQGRFLFKFTTNKLSLFHNSKCILGRSVVIHKFPDDLGLQGLFDETVKEFVSYENMTTEQLVQIASILGYVKFSERVDRKSIIEKLNSESVTTGNASTRIACAIIGICKE